MKPESLLECHRRSVLRGALWGAFGSALAGSPLRALAGEPSPRAWPAVTALVEKYVAARQVSGMIAALGWGAQPPRYIARGLQGFGDPAVVGPDTLFRAYSMTKPLTGMIAMQLIAEGKLALDQPLADFAPEFGAMRVAIDPAKGLESRPAKTAITIRHLLTHTSGLGYAVIGRNAVAEELARQGINPALVARQRFPHINDYPPAPPPDEFLRRTATVPLVAEPGTRWSYSMGLDVLGIVLARIEGKPGLGEVMAERLFEPLGMTSSTFVIPPSAAAHLSTNYFLLAGVPVPIDKPGDSVFRDPPPFAFGGSGLITSPADYDRFLAMICGGGALAGKRVLAASAVAMGIGDLLPPAARTDNTFIAGYRFGAAGIVGTGKDAGLYGWSGAAGTIGFAQTRIGLRTGLFTQYMPSESLPILKEFPKAVGADLAAMGMAPAATTGPAPHAAPLPTKPFGAQR